MADMEKKRGGRQYKKIEYLGNEKSFSDDLENIFHVYMFTLENY